jgi:DNA replication protein DnaC
MNNAATIEKMKSMKLAGMARMFEELTRSQTNALTSDECIAHLVDAEYEDRRHRSLKRRLRFARLRFNASIDEIHYQPDRGLDRNAMQRYRDAQWIRNGENLLITGKTGCGKSFIACALGLAACTHGLRVRYFNCMKLFSSLKMAKIDGSYQREVVKLAKTDVIILDDFGLEVLDAQSRLMLFEIVEDRYGTKSTIMISQVPTQHWHDIIGEPTVADAVCDRIVRRSTILEIGGDSMR